MLGSGTSSYKGNIMDALIVILLGVIIDVLGGAAISTMWGWFIQNTFHLPGLSIFNAAGILLMYEVFGAYNYISIRLLISDDFDSGHIIKSYVHAASGYAMIFAVGWVFHLFM